MTTEQKRTTPHMASTSNQEWQWAIVVSIVLVFVTSIPLFRALWDGRISSDKQFMGVIFNPLDGATYLSKIQLGTEGHWRTYFRHSPNVTEGAYLDLLYTGLGHLSGYLGLSNVQALHSLRLLAAFLMCLSLYQLAATIWQRQRNRRLFFLLSLLGSGFGWVLILFGESSSPDIAIPEAFPLYSSLANAHFPLALAVMALSTAIIIRVFRPGWEEPPHVGNGGLMLFIYSLILAVIAPHALVPFAGGVGLVVAINWVKERRIDWWRLQWLMMLVLPALPLALYYLAEVRYNPAVAIWSAQNITLTPPPRIFFMGLGLPFLVALPSIYRAIRRFEPDGDQFMLVWLLSIFVAIYIPVDPQRRFAMGIMIPITYFAVRTLDSFWVHLNPTRRQNRLSIMLVTFSSITYLFLIIVGFMASASQNDARFFLSQDYVDAFEWLENENSESVVVLADPLVSLWLPGWSGMRAVYAHPYETINAEENQRLVSEWYGATDVDSPICEELLARFEVAYVFAGEIEADYNLGCVDNLDVVQQFGDLTVYAP